MLSRIVGKLKTTLDFNGGAAVANANPDKVTYREMKRGLAGIPRFQPGHVAVPGWDLEYVDGPALLSCFDVLVVKRWNDFRCDREDPVILDCGANVGISALHYKKLYPKARIVAFEPDKKICNVLRRNLEANAAGDVEVVEAAVWTTNGEHLLFAEGADGSRLGEGAAPADVETYAVKTVRLADYLDRGPVDFIKLDIEGAESDVLVDCADKLAGVGSMVIEFHLMSSNPQPLAATMKVLADAGFDVALNSYGRWIDLIHPPVVHSGADAFGFDQYLLISAWRRKESR